MTAMSRREFMARAAICSGVAGILAASVEEPKANPLGLPIGSQVWPRRPMLKDFPAFAKRIAEIGVTRLKLCSPIGYGADYFLKYPGRFFSMHLQDVDVRPGGSHPQVALGKGSIDWVKTFTAAKVGGVRNYFVEQPWELTQQSVAYLKTLNV